VRGNVRAEYKRGRGERKFLQKREKTVKRRVRKFREILPT